MILSVSRRTDIPSFYMDWFLNRLRAGWLLVRNPFNLNRVSRICLDPSMAECLVFWSKNPEPMLARLDELKPYPFYLQYTLHNYGPEMESRLPDLNRRLAVFEELSARLGPARVVWRYSPLIISHRYTPDYHVETFARLADRLSGRTGQCKLSFLDIYAKIAARVRSLGIVDPADEEKFALARRLNDMAAERGISLTGCGNPDLRPAGIAPSSCIDGELIQRITGRTMFLKKDPNQREGCNCAESIDIGAYQTCLNGCAYCYANHSHSAAMRRSARYDPGSSFLCDSERPGDITTERKKCLYGGDRLEF